MKLFLVSTPEEADKVISNNEKPCHILTADNRLLHFSKNGELSLRELSNHEFQMITSHLKISKGALEDIKTGAVSHHSMNLNVNDSKYISKMEKIAKSNTWIHQDNIIPFINEYFKSNNLELNANRNGICNGLSAVFCKYVFEGKEKEFFQTLKKIQKMKSKGMNEPDLSVNLFMQEVLYAFKPKMFDDTLQQRDGVKVLSVDNPELKMFNIEPRENTSENISHNQLPDKKQNLKVAFQFAAAAASKDQLAKVWAPIFDQIKTNGACYMITGPSHTIAMTYLSGQPETFRVYDPNFETGYQDFKSAKELAQSLDKSFMWPEPKKGEKPYMPIGVQVVENPYKPLNFKFPDKNILVNKLIDIDGISSVTASLAEAIFNHDRELVEIIYQKTNATPNFELIQYAVELNALEILPILFQKAEPKFFNNIANNLLKLGKIALKSGNDKAFDLIAECSAQKELEFTAKNLPRWDISLMEDASLSGNPKCIEKVLNIFRENGPENFITAKAIENAVKSGRISAVELLLKEKSKLTSIEVVSCLKHAFASNHVGMVNYFLDKYPEYDVVQHMTITQIDVQEKNMQIIDRLVQKGAILTPLVQEEIAEKRPVDISHYYQNTHRFHAQPVKHKNLTGDHAKIAILKKFKNMLDVITTPEELEKFKKDVTSTADYKILAKSQGITTTLFKNMDTSSIKALNRMIAHKEKELGLNDAGISITPKIDL